MSVGCVVVGPQVDVVVASVQTLGRGGPHTRARRLRYKAWGGIVVVDEAHHLRVDSTYDTVLKTFGLGGRRPEHQLPPSRTSRVRKLQLRARAWGSEELSDPVQPADGDSPAPLRRLLLGFTATPFRMDRACLGDFLDVALQERNLVWGIQHGWLVDIVVYRVRSEVNLDSVSKQEGDWAPKALSQVVNVEDRNSAVVKAIKEHAGKQVGSAPLPRPSRQCRSAR